jgi:hypothetical protein
MTASAPGGPVIVRKARSAVRLVTYKGGRAATRISNMSRKQARRYGTHLSRAWRIVSEKTRNVGLTSVNLSRLAVRRLLSVHKPFVRLRRRSERVREQRAAIRFERQVEARVRRTASSGRPIILGPWISEVGFEVLYWVPFLRWLKAEYNWDPATAVVVSRGGVRSWYAGLADTYVEIFDFMDAATFARRNEARREGGDGSHKQLGLSDLDREILDHTRRATGRSDAVVVHPSDMYLLLRNYWLGHRPVSYVEERTRHATQTVPDTFDLSSLPDDYVAVKAYTAKSLPDTPANRQVLHSLVEHLASFTNVVTLDTGLQLDDHEDYGLGRHPRVFNLSGLMTPANNLGLQTQVIARARAFVGTCGSLTWLAPLLGVRTVALMSDTRFLHPHLYFARKAYLQSGAAGFATVDVSAVDDVAPGLLPALAGTARLPPDAAPQS